MQSMLPPAAGTLSGVLRSDEYLRNEQACSADADWPMWLGPTGNRNAANTNAVLIDSLFDARPVWKCEPLTAGSPGRANDIPRHGVRSLYNRASGGGATPIVADGKVFLNYYIPSGEAYDKQVAQIYAEQLTGKDNISYFQGKLPTLDPLKVAADDVVIAVDAHTGALVWRTTFPGGGANHTSHKNDLNNLTMVYANGRAYAVGSTMRLRCLDANTGELIWQQPLGPITTSLEAERDKGIETGVWIKKRNRDWGFAPIVLAGLVISSDMSGGVVAFDAATGEERWRAAKVAWKNSTPHGWTHDGQHCIIIAGWQQISCLDAEDGAVRWTIPAVAYRSITISGNLLAYGDTVGPPDATDRNVAREKDPGNHVLVVMELDLEQPRLLWHTPWNLPVEGSLVKGQYSGYCRPQIVGDRLFLSGNYWTDCFDARSGKRLARLEAEGGVFNAGHLLAAHGRLFSIVDGKHGTTRIAMYTTEPNNFRPTGPDRVWVPPHANTTSYGPYMYHPVVDGRIFIRGHDAIYCYDLRKQ
jgi:outer membrane protein assembly factor BamB